MTNYVMKYKTGEYVALDRSSGGYPYRVTDVLRAERWTDLNNIWSYISSFKSEIEAAAYPIEVRVLAGIPEPLLPQECRHECDTNYTPNYQRDSKHFLDCPVMNKVLGK